MPPAPATLITCALFTSFSATSACWIERAVWSQPPPGAAGAMIFTSICARAGGAKNMATANSGPLRIARLRDCIVCLLQDRMDTKS